MKPLKKLILVLTLSTGALSALAQGTIIFGNHIAGSVFAPIYGPDLDNPTAAQQGNDPSGIPPGTTVYTGPRLAGSWFTVQLWAGPDANSLAPCATATFGTGAGAGFFASQTATISGVAGGSPATVQLRAWDNEGGTLTTWALAIADGAPATGFSAIFTTPPLGGGGTIITPPNLVGLTSFNLHHAPEPSTLALAGLGAALWVVFRRLGGTSRHK